MENEWDKPITVDVTFAAFNQGVFESCTYLYLCYKQPKLKIKFRTFGQTGTLSQVHIQRTYKR